MLWWKQSNHFNHFGFIAVINFSVVCYICILFNCFIWQFIWWLKLLSSCVFALFSSFSSTSLYLFAVRHFVTFVCYINKVITVIIIILNVQKSSRLYLCKKRMITFISNNESICCEKTFDLNHQWWLSPEQSQASGSNTFSLSNTQ